MTREEELLILIEKCIDNIKSMVVYHENVDVKDIELYIRKLKINLRALETYRAEYLSLIAC